jgi:hypothetical protein
MRIVRRSVMSCWLFASGHASSKVTTLALRVYRQA